MHKKVVEDLLNKAGDFVGEFAFSAIVQSLAMHYWKRILLIALLLLVALGDLILRLVKYIRALSLEEMIASHPYSVLLISIFSLWFISTLPGSRK